MNPGDLFDLILAFAMVWLALRLIVAADLLKATVLFITLSLMMALAWVRLRAPDIALAEAAIGAGITGVLLLDTLGHLKRNRAARGKVEGEGRAPDERP